jgi:hypothetical protein
LFHLFFNYFLRARVERILSRHCRRFVCRVRLSMAGDRVPAFPCQTSRTSPYARQRLRAPQRCLHTYGLPCFPPSRLPVPTQDTANRRDFLVARAAEDFVAPGR